MLFLILLLTLAAHLQVGLAQPCDKTYVLGSTAVAGQYGYPTQINLPHPRTNPCVIKLINHDVWEHGISPIKPADGSISLAGFYFGGQVVYPTTTAGLGGQEIQVTVQPDWPEGTYEFYCIFHGTRGKIVLGNGAGCTLPVAGCIPTDPPSPANVVPCGGKCTNLVPQLPTCDGTTKVSYLGQAFCHVETQTCKFPESRENCAQTTQGAPSGNTCLNGVCVPVGTATATPDTGFCLPCNKPPANHCKTIGNNPHYASIAPDVGVCGLNAVGGYQCNYSPALNIDCTNLNAKCVNGACVSNAGPTPVAPSPVAQPTIAGQAPTIAGQAPTIAGQAPTFAGQAPTFAGQAPTFAGQAPTVAGQAPSASSGSSCLTSAACTQFCAPYGYEACDCARVKCKDPATTPVFVPQEGIRHTFPDGTVVHVDGTGKTTVMVPGKPVEEAATEPLPDGSFTAKTPTGLVFTVVPSTKTVTKGGVPPSECLVAPFDKCNALCDVVLNCSCDAFECEDSLASAASALIHLSSSPLLALLAMIMM